MRYTLFLFCRFAAETGAGAVPVLDFRQVMRGIAQQNNKRLTPDNF